MTRTCRGGGRRRRRQQLVGLRGRSGGDHAGAERRRHVRVVAVWVGVVRRRLAVAVAAVVARRLRPQTTHTHGITLATCTQGGYIFYAGGSIAGVSCRRRWPRLLLLS